MGSIPRGVRLSARWWSVSLALTVLAMLVATPAFAESPETSFIDGATMPPNVRPVLILSGSDYDMGYQYYQGLNLVHGSGYFQSQVCDSFTSEQIAALKAYQWLMMQETPEMIEFVKGAASAATDAGVELSYAEVLANFTSLKTFSGTEPEGSQDEDLPPAGCSGWAAWGTATTDGRLIAGGSTDGDSTRGSRPTVALMCYPETGNNFIVANATFSGGRGVFHSCMNNKGLTLVHHGGNYVGNGFVGFGPHGYGVPPYFAAMHTLRFADNAVQAKDMQVAYTLMDRHNKGLWVDVEGNAFDIESKDPMSVREPGYMGETDFIYATNNTMHRALEEYQEPSPEMGLFYIPHAGYLGATYHYYDPDSITRNLQLWNMLHNYAGKVDIEFAKMIWRFPGERPEYPTLEEADAAFEPTLGKGWHAVVGNLSNSSVCVCLPDNGDGGRFLINNGGVARGGNPECPEYYYYPPEQTYTFYELTLAASPEDAVEAARTKAHYDLYYADRELRELSYLDEGYDALSDIFDQAATEFVRAQYYAGLAGQNSGNEAIVLWGKALRAYTRCQAYATQVYETLVPPANDPRDLGLKKWFGKWGDWATRGYPWDSNNPKDTVAEMVAPPTGE